MGGGVKSPAVVEESNWIGMDEGTKELGWE